MSDTSSPLLVVGIGASAGGLDALTRFFKTVPQNAQIAFIVVQHLDPHHESILAEILSRHSTFTFCQATNNQIIEAGKAYVIPGCIY